MWFYEESKFGLLMAEGEELQRGECLGDDHWSGTDGTTKDNRFSLEIALYGAHAFVEENGNKRRPRSGAVQHNSLFDIDSGHAQSRQRDL